MNLPTGGYLFAGSTATTKVWSPSACNKIVLATRRPETCTARATLPYYERAQVMWDDVAGLYSCPDPSGLCSVAMTGK